ncbi:hypothetical protein N9L68_03270, partial [bacterium]|nr:hypothetical protein [bacterium]
MGHKAREHAAKGSGYYCCSYDGPCPTCLASVFTAREIAQAVASHVEDNPLVILIVLICASFLLSSMMRPGSASVQASVVNLLTARAN